MKKVLFIVAMLWNVQLTLAQSADIMVWNKWCTRTDTAILYPTGNNEVLIVAEGMDPKDIVVKSLDHALKISAPDYKGDTISFLAMPYPKYGHRLRLSITSKKTKKELKQVSFSCGEEPVPIAQLGTVSKNEAHKKDINGQAFLRVVFDNSLYCYPYKVKGYTFKTRIAGKDYVIPVKGFYLTKEIQTILTNAPVGTFMEFVDIEAACAQCNPRKLPDIRFWMR